MFEKSAAVEGSVMARWKQEEKTKGELLAQANSIRKEREQLESSAKSKEDAIKLKAEASFQKYKDDIQKLEKEISQLRLKSDSSKIAALKRGINGSLSSKLTNSQNTPATKQSWDTRKSGMANGFQEFSGSGGVKRERECVMCLSDEMSVGFLPCAHQVVCKKCNELHEKQGMNDCPSCQPNSNSEKNCRSKTGHMSPSVSVGFDPVLIDPIVVGTRSHSIGLK
ncbi:hypothetical protein RDABS01_015559 [Bienertia sinuspersici]